MRPETDLRSGGKERDSGFELLRIIWMLLIIGYHYYYHGGGPGPQLWVNLFRDSGVFTNGFPAVAGFFLLTGWHLSAARFQWRKVLRMLGTLVFCSWLGLLIAALFDPGEMTTLQVVVSLLPISSTRSWFAGAYIAAYCFLPFIQKGCAWLRGCRGREYDLFVGLGFLFFVIFKFLSPMHGLPSEFIWAVYLFCLGDWLKLRFGERLPSIRLCLLGYLGTMLFQFGWTRLFGVLAEKSELAALYADHIVARYSPTVVLGAIFMIFLFAQVHFSSRLVNRIAACNFGVYLLHDNGILHHLWWFKILKTDYYSTLLSRYQILHFLFSVVFVYGVCVLFDLLRQATAERLWMKLVDRFLARFSAYEHTDL